MKILAIGNSFSEDATYYLYKIAKSAGIDITVYRYKLNGVHTDRYVSIKEALNEQTRDIVTVHQQSGSAGVYSSYGCQSFECDPKKIQLIRNAAKKPQAM